jgi:hypothetical protein
MNTYFFNNTIKLNSINPRTLITSSIMNSLVSESFRNYPLFYQYFDTKILASALFSLLKQRHIRSDFSEMHCFIADTFLECILISSIFYLNYFVVEEIIPFDI